MWHEILTGTQRKLWGKLAGADLIADFYLAGGTAAALRLGHRESVDFDFFTEKEFSIDSIAATITKLSTVTIEQSDTGTLHTIMDSVRTSFLSYHHPLIAPAQNCNGIQIADLYDIIPMKLIATAQRGMRKDFYDIYAFFEAGWSLDAMFEAMERKFVNVHYNRLHILKSLTYFKDADEDEQPRSLTGTKWKEVKERLVERAADYTLASNSSGGRKSPR